MRADQCEIGIVGLGLMGWNLLLYMAGHGHSVAGYNKEVIKETALRQEAENVQTRAAETLPEFLDLLRGPRAVMMLVPAGAPVDAEIHDLLPYLADGDLIIDGGNSHLTDTDLRVKTLAEHGIQFLGVGVSGGEHGARHGPKHEYQLNLETVALIWRSGCIIRAALLEDICAALQARCDRPNLLLAPSISNKVMDHQETLRRLVCAARIVVEKPIGSDLESARRLNRALTKSFHEAQIAEDVGIGHHGKYFKQAGELRDMVQNHLMQLLCLVAMEAPVSSSADEIRDKKVAVLHALRPLSPDEVHANTARAQYGRSTIEGKGVRGYREEQDVAPDSPTETYAALKLFVDNWRWQDVHSTCARVNGWHGRLRELSSIFARCRIECFPPTPCPTRNRLA